MRAGSMVASRYDWVCLFSRRRQMELGGSPAPSASVVFSVSTSSSSAAQCYLSLCSYSARHSLECDSTRHTSLASSRNNFHLREPTLTLSLSPTAL